MQAGRYVSTSTACICWSGASGRPARIDVRAKTGERGERFQFGGERHGETRRPGERIVEGLLAVTIAREEELATPAVGTRPLGHLNGMFAFALCASRFGLTRALKLRHATRLAPISIPWL